MCAGDLEGAGAGGLSGDTRGRPGRRGLTAGVRAAVILAQPVQLLVLLLRQLEPLLLNLVDLLLGIERLLGHDQVLLQHPFLLAPPLFAGVLDLRELCNGKGARERLPSKTLRLAAFPQPRDEKTRTSLIASTRAAGASAPRSLLERGTHAFRPHGRG